MHPEHPGRSLVLLLAFFAAILLPATVYAACSSSIGQATINEVYRLGGTQFVEVKLLDSSIGASTYNAWSLRVCDSGGCSTYSLNTATVTYPYLVVNNVSNINLNSAAAMDVVLRDAAGNAIDYLSVNASPYQNPPAACAPSSFLYPYSYPNTSSNKKGIYRNPDGTGDWVELLDSGGGGLPTEGGDNSVSTVGAFNAYDTTTAAGAIVGNIVTKVAGAPFSIDIVAISNQAILTTYNRTVSVQLLDASDNSAPLVDTCRSSWVSIQAPISATFAAGDNGRKTVSFLENNAWRQVRLRVAEGSNIGCSLDNFAIRPAAFTLVASDLDWQTAGTSRTLANTGASGGNTHKAGRPFTLRATAVNASGAVTTNYAGQPEAALSPCAGTACPAGLGTLNTGAWSPNPGPSPNGLIISTATYDEVGAFALTLEDRTFADIDADDSATAERYFSSSPQAVGRFVPDHFLLSAVTAPVFRTFNDAACPTRFFTYLGQPFGYATAPVVRIEARSAAGNTTANYAGALWKVAAAGVTQVYASLLPLTPPLDTSLVGGATVTVNGDGTGTVTPNGADVVAFFRTGTVVPFNAAISWTASVADNSENGVAGNGIISAAAPVVFNGGGGGIPFDAGNEFRFGRLVLLNAFGPEILPLTVPLRAEYFDGTDFIPNFADSCTPYSAAAGNLSFEAFYPSLNAGETAGSGAGTLVNGTHHPNQPLVLSAPGAGNHGSADLALGVEHWLRFDWDGIDQGGDGNLNDDNPRARATFGIYKGNRRLIYLREVY